MEKEEITLLKTQPQAEADNLALSPTDTTPETIPEKAAGITLKFNKEIREIPYEEAVVLAQKGLKFDKISAEFDRLKQLAVKSGKSISEYITEIESRELSERRSQLLEGCAGNEELTDHILSLEKEAKNTHSDALAQLKEEFPEINSTEDLPDEVRESVELLGGNLLTAYLLYNHRQRRAAEISSLKQQQSREASVGSQQRYAAENTGGIEEFIKGIWS